MTHGKVILKIFLEGYKKTPLTVIFSTLLDPITGNPFFMGINLYNKTTKSEENVNINLPSFVRKFLLYGQEVGWNGTNQIDSLDGVIILKKWGYDTSKIAYFEYDEVLRKTVIKYYH